jgi:hypothetical protein
MNQAAFKKSVQELFKQQEKLLRGATAIARRQWHL